jgi:hypothetical protein
MRAISTPDAAGFTGMTRPTTSQSNRWRIADSRCLAVGTDRARIGGLIHEADTVVLVVSPEAVKSERCACEVDKTVAWSKRLLPVIWIDVPEADVPAKLTLVRKA